MKKLSFFLLVFVLIFSSAWGFDIKERTFELGINVGASFHNDSFSVRDVFREIFVLNIDKFLDGFNMNFGAGVIPMFFNYKSKDGWGIGLSIGAEAVGVFNFSGKMLSFSEAVDDASEINGAVFADIAIPTFFHIKKLKIKVKPAVYVPVAYAKSDISYTFSSTEDGIALNIGYEVNVFTAFPTGDNAEFRMTARPGIDFHLGAEYPLSEVLGIKDKISILDFDVGLELINIPFMPSEGFNYMKMTGSIGSGEPVNFFAGDEVDMDSFFSFDGGDTQHGEDLKVIYRPFKTLVWASWRPLGTKLLTVTPTIGFAINSLYTKPFSLEAGLKARFDLFNLFIATVGVGYHDRLWKNSIDLAFNFRAIQINIGADLRSPNFSQSWTGSGFGLYVGVILGW